MRLQKSYPIASFKALPDEDGLTGRFEAIVAVFGNVDLQGDRLVEGAFTKSLDKWRGAGDPVPIIWSHEWGDPFAHIGYATPDEVEELASGQKAGMPRGGLLVRGHLDVEKPFARQVYDLLKERRVKEFSFAYDVVKERAGKDRANELVEVDLIEVGPTLKGANPMTVSLGVKAGEAPAEVETEVHDRLIAAALEIDPAIASALVRGPDRPPVADTALAELRAMLDAPAPVTEPVPEPVPEISETVDEPPADAPVADAPAAEETVEVAAEETVEDAEKAIEAALKAGEADGMKWDGGAAMASAHSAGDFRKIAFERDNDSDPDTAAHWALPHHASPGADADPDGVSAALGALNGSRGGGPDLKDADAARNHLEAHGGGGEDAAEPEGEKDAEPDGEKAGKVIGAKRVSDLKSAIGAAIDEWATAVNGDAVAEEKAEEPAPEPEPEVKDDAPADEKIVDPVRAALEERLKKLLG